MFKVITGKPLWVNFLVGLLLILLIILVFLSSLKLITHHGRVMKIPAVTGQSYAEAKKSLESQGFDVMVQDSVYTDSMPPMQVVKQFPEAENLVKVNRTVYLTINRSVPPIVDMPNLVSMTFRTAEMLLRQYGLKLEDTVFKPDFAKNSVLEQQYKNEPIKPGTKIQQGSAITLVLGNGVGMEFYVPDLFGLDYREARSAVESSGLILGSVVPDPDVTDTTHAYVYRQSPPRFDDEKKPNHIRQGQAIDIFLAAQKPVRGTDSLVAAPAAPSNGY